MHMTAELMDHISLRITHSQKRTRTYVHGKERRKRKRIQGNNKEWVRTGIEFFRLKEKQKGIELLMSFLFLITHYNVLKHFTKVYSLVTLSQAQKSVLK